MKHISLRYGFDDGKQCWFVKNQNEGNPNKGLRAIEDKYMLGPFKKGEDILLRALRISGLSLMSQYGIELKDGFID